MILGANEQIACINAPFCSVQSPIYDVLTAGLCINALFRKDHYIIVELCTSEIVKADPTPHANILFHDQ